MHELGNETIRKRTVHAVLRVTDDCLFVQKHRDKLLKVGLEICDRNHIPRVLQQFLARCDVGMGAKHQELDDGLRHALLELAQ